MKQKLLLTLVITSFMVAASAQKRVKQTTAYAITSIEKGNGSWTEVRLVDIATGNEVQSIYKSSNEVPVLNARTGKVIEKKDRTGEIKEMALNKVRGGNDVVISTIETKEGKTIITRSNDLKYKIEIEKLIKTNGNTNVNTNVNTDVNTNVNTRVERRVVGYMRHSVNTDQPFATSSAACAYDTKHDRLYYTPMGINQLRYIDLKSKDQKIYYFEDEPFGALSSRHDVPNQITRMVMGADGNGYALTNNGEHLIKFTTKKKAEITDLGSLTDDAANGNYSVHSRNGYGGDMIADKSGSLYLITANRNVFKIDIKNMTATFKGSIKGLPQGYSTNGAMVEGGTTIIVSSARSTSGYYKFDLNTLQAEKYSTGSEVYNASDLAGGNLVSDKKKKDPETPVEEIRDDARIIQPNIAAPALLENKVDVSAYPNPVTNGVVNLSFKGFPTGKYQVEFMDVSGQTLSTKNVILNSKSQVVEYKLPKLIAKGNYMIKVLGENNKTLSVEQLIVQ